jgi:hypothetical protein
MAKWCSIAPIYYSDIEEKIELPFDLGYNIRLLLKPGWITEDAISKYLGHSRRDWLINEANYAIEVLYDAASYGAPDPDWKGEHPRSMQDRALEFINLCNIAIWLSNPCDFRYELVFDVYKHEDKEKWNFRSYHEYIGLKPHKRYMDYKLNMNDLLLSRNLLGVLMEIQRPSPVWVAIRSLWRALTEDSWEVRFLLMWIALEGLFGPYDPRELTYRLSQRLSFFLSDENKKTTKHLYDDIKKVYGWRSKVVHGMRLNKLSDEKSDDILYDAERWIRLSLIKILSNLKLLSIFSINKERETYLDSIIFA